jgi:transposase
MQSMKHQHTLVIGGVDSHADTHHVVAMDPRGVLPATKGFPTATPGYRELLDWLCAFGEVDVVAVESTGSYAAALVRYLREHSVRVLEVNQPHAHTCRGRGKSDPIDAEMAARLALSGTATTVPKQAQRSDPSRPEPPPGPTPARIWSERPRLWSHSRHAVPAQIHR